MKQTWVFFEKISLVNLFIECIDCNTILKRKKQHIAGSILHFKGVNVKGICLLLDTIALKTLSLTASSYYVQLF